MKRRKRDLASRTAAARLAIDNLCRDQQGKEQMAQYGYDEHRIGQLRAMLDRLEKLRNQRMQALAEQHRASDALKAGRAWADKYYKNLLKIARVAFADSKGAWERAGLSGRRDRTFAGWLVQARQFYEGIAHDDAMLKMMGRYGVTGAKLRAGLDMVSEVEKLDRAHKAMMAHTRQAGLDLRQAAKAFNKAMSAFYAIARVALENRPDLLNAMGIAPAHRPKAE